MDIFVEAAVTDKAGGFHMIHKDPLGCMGAYPIRAMFGACCWCTPHPKYAITGLDGTVYQVSTRMWVVVQIMVCFGSLG